MKNILTTTLINNHIAKLFLSLLAFLFPLKTLFIFILFIITVDFFTGIVKSKRKNIKITSGGFKETVFKMLMYNMLMVVVYCFEKIILQLDGMFLTLYSMGFVILTEIKSIFENVAEITDNKSILNSFKFIDNIFKKKVS